MTEAKFTPTPEEMDNNPDNLLIMLCAAICHPSIKNDLLSGNVNQFQSILDEINYNPPILENSESSTKPFRLSNFQIQLVQLAAKTAGGNFNTFSEEIGRLYYLQSNLPK